VNTGDTRHRGFEGQIDYDFLAVQDPHTTRHLSVFANLGLLNAEFTSTRNPANLGNKPAFSPSYLARSRSTASTSRSNPAGCSPCSDRPVAARPRCCA
jgi:Fe(3+) dicitrate transport protein